MNTGVIPTIYRRIVCSLWKGHNYKRVSQEYQGKVMCKCTYCQKEKIVDNLAFELLLSNEKV